ncbi:MAG: nicotinate phosphoribosyltransferase [candidate division WOR-3 bacterium]|nr:nicotinate phosphoribosyltransferase [candidate division WOR-3 bacterium]MCX7948373.1 nicotinate phosphoribosyltransferase [candidate division WOR-3 bacterium]MDW8151273.1 nicotinate phosphoribosyltransferase [candidate division WOR-3 bacterium]
MNVSMLMDLYELTMAYSYFKSSRNEISTFEVFIRNLPENRNFLVSAGIDDIIEIIINFRFEEDDIKYLRSLKIFSEDFLEYLKKFKFTGDLYAMPNGQIYFPNEPVIRITAPRIQAQMFETIVLNQFNFQSMIASKCARITLASRNIPCVDFSPRRDHGIDSAIKVAKVSYMCGFIGTSNLLAGKLYNIPVYGTMAHSYIMSFDSEEEAFREFLKRFSEPVLLIDTYDTIEGAKKVIKLLKEGYRIKGVRIDSGDLVKLSKEVKKIFENEGFGNIKIFLSGDLDEYVIENILNEGAVADFFGIGTKMGTSSDAPYLNGVYKLVEDEYGFKIKTSPQKLTLPGKKQVYRIYENGLMKEDIIVLEDDKINGEPLLKKYIENGKLVERIALESSRKLFMENLLKIPPYLKNIKTQEMVYPVKISKKLLEIQESLIKSF